jgi:hypothetical protein
VHVAYPGAELDILDFKDCLSNRSAPEELEMEVDGMWCRPRRMRYGHVGAGNEQKTRGDVAAIGYFDLPVSVYLMLFGASKKQVMLTKDCDMFIPLPMHHSSPNSIA